MELKKLIENVLTKIDFLKADIKKIKTLSEDEENKTIAAEAGERKNDK